MEPLQEISELSRKLLSVLIDHKLVCVNIQITENTVHCKPYLVPANGNYYNSVNDEYTLISFYEDKEQKFSGSSIVGFNYPESHRKEKFFDETTETKKAYLRMRAFAKDVDLYDEMWFNENTDPFKVKLFLAFGVTIPSVKLINAIQGTKQLLKKELAHCKQIWMEEHAKRKLFVLEMIDKETAAAVANKEEDMVNELNNIKKEYDAVEAQYTAAIEETKKLSELIQYWHPLLLPAPEYLRF